MVIGDIYWADVPFENRPGSKIRPVIVIDAEPTPTVAVLKATSQFQPNLKLLYSIDFDAPRYYRLPLRGKSYFYKESLIELELSRFVRRIGMLHQQDLAGIVKAVEAL
ncbi:MAG TPA: type II toxin-antitoxin system PemK/MazF family toxin [Planctomycetota bacterium]|nr:type II toxin-antitoxin system PemK/MazF family toxin [Planctomycetota bacterium]